MKSVKLKILMAATGLCARQAAALLNVSEPTVRAWCYGQRKVPDDAIEGLHEYYENMMEWASQHSWPVPDVTTEEEARSQGFHSVSSYRIAAGKVFLENS